MELVINGEARSFDLRLTLAGLIERLGMKQDLFRSYNALGLLARDEERLDDATVLFSQAIDAATAKADTVALTQAIMNSGLVAQDRATFDAARALFERARRVAESKHDSDPG